jgi:TRAP-type C4-dicarboxylate transport system substrate-binding protein
VAWEEASDVYEQVRLVAPIVKDSDTGFFADYVPDFAILNGPYFLAEPGDCKKIIDSHLYKGRGDEQRNSSGFELIYRIGTSELDT